MPTSTLRFDLRVPPFAHITHGEQYRAALEMAEWADRRGIRNIVVSEHHGTDDGFMPAPLTVAAALLARTRDAVVTVSALLLPLHDPLRIAEQVATIDLLSGGRIVIVAGLGYRPEEFAMAGVDPRRRAALFEEYVTVLRRAWTGEPFEYRGVTCRATPAPSTRPHPPLFVGGSTEIAARRAARLGLPFMPAVNDPALVAAYEDACAATGFTGGFVLLPRGPGFVHVTRDPDKARAQLAPHVLYDAQTYASWQIPGQRSAVDVRARTVEDVWSSGVYRIVTPDECLALAREVGNVTLHPLMGGMPVEMGWESLELFADEVLPRLTATPESG
jgi:alkanesulfonate monooxygenase SsuD/methylene tetrahydromethanopterin reductase-like flavin-dependent oxidoreductase (luciferase family)